MAVSGPLRPGPAVSRNGDRGRSFPFSEKSRSGSYLKYSLRSGAIAEGSETRSQKGVFALDGFSRRRFIQTIAITGASTGSVAVPGVESVFGALAPGAPTSAELAPGTLVRGRRTLTFTSLTNGTVTASPTGDRLILEVQGILWSLPRAGERPSP